MNEKHFHLYKTLNYLLAILEGVGVKEASVDSLDDQKVIEYAITWSRS